MTESRAIQVEARVILNPTRIDPVTKKAKTSPMDLFVTPNTLLPATSVAIVYPLNNIPTASVVLAVGRRETSGLFSAITPSEMKKLVRRVNVLIEVKLTGVDSESDILGDLQEALGIPKAGSNLVNPSKWPSNFITIFDGFTTGTNLQKSFEDAGYQLNVVHWLATLFDSSVISSRVHPLTPTDYRGQIPQADLSYSAGYITFPQLNNVMTDIWGKGILPAFNQLMEDPHAVNTVLSRLGEDVENGLESALKAMGITLSGADILDTGNRTAKDALQRFVTWDALSNLYGKKKAEANSAINKIEVERTKKRSDKEKELLTWLQQDYVEKASAPGVHQDDLDTVIFNDLIKISKESKKAYPVLDDEAAILNDPDLFAISRVTQGDLTQELPVVPLSLSIKLNDLMVGQKVGKTLNALIDGDVSNLPTFWHRLQLMVSTFDVAIVPAVNSAAVVPLGIGYSKPWRTIEASEILLSQGVGTTESIPRGCVLLQPAACPSGYSGSVAWIVPTTGAIKFDLLAELITEYNERKRTVGIKKEDLAAIKANTVAALKGQWLFLRSPSWLNFWVGLDGELQKTVKPNGTGAMQFSTAAGLEGPTREIQSKIFDPAQHTSLRNLGTQCAMGRLQQELFKKRGMTVVSKFRLDIAPGSTVKVNTMGAGITNLPIIGDYSGFLQGLVTQVTLNLDAESGDASTVLSMGFVRNESECASLSLSPGRHPIYGGAWLGGHLASRDKTLTYQSLLPESAELNTVVKEF